MTRYLLAVLLLTCGGQGAYANGESDDPTGAGQMQIGGMVSVSPRYEGSSDYRVIGFPYFVPPRSGMLEAGTVQFRGVDDLRFRLIRAGDFEAGPLVGWRFGREEDDGRRLRGLGDIDGGLIAGGYAAYRIGFLKPFLSYHHQLTGDGTGGILRLGADADFKLDDAISMRATLGSTYASGEYMSHYFGITELQAASSEAGLGAYEAGAGIKDVYLGLSTAVRLNDMWTLRVGGKFTRLLGDAEDSPIVESADQLSGTVGLSYRVDWRR